VFGAESVLEIGVVVVRLERAKLTHMSTIPRVPAEREPPRKIDRVRK
jgi:hypothetical protein